MHSRTFRFALSCGLTLLVVMSWASVVTGWTTAGSTGTVDEASLSIVSLRGPFVEMGGHCLFQFLGFTNFRCSLNTGTVTVRYNVVPSGALYRTTASGFQAFAFKARLRDSGNAQEVSLRLQAVNIQSGAETTVLTLDSNSLAPSSSYQTAQSPNSCTFGLDFDSNVYYIEATISNNDSSSGASPGLELITITGCPTL